MHFYIKSTSFSENEIIPRKYTCDGKDISPELRWDNVPNGTKSFVPIVDDPDAISTTWTHWIIYNIPHNIQKLEEGITSLPSPAKIGMNSWKVARYNGPCPEPHGKEHRYYFKLYALNEILQPHHHISSENIEKLIQHNIIGKAQLIGRYKRTPPTLVHHDKPHKQDFVDAMTVLNKKDVNQDIKKKAFKEIEEITKKL